ncbi:MAG: SAM-dependent methyltransferase [Pseudomonadota bacterium]
MRCVTPGAPKADGLPVLPPELLAHGEQVLVHLCQRIETAGGALDFADFMREALYAPGLGYYAAGLPKFGAAGDFVTAPEVSPLFARALARQVAEVLEAIPNGEVLEFGAGSGALAVELLLELERLDRLPRRYLILDLSASLRAVQRERLAQRAPHLLELVRWIDAWPGGFAGVIVGNEVLDALPLRLLEIRADGPVRICVTLGEGGLAWGHLPASDEDRATLAEIETRRGEPFPVGYRVEFHPELPGWILGLAHALKQGVAILFDYGGTARELYAPERWMGTLRCHLRHHAHDDPLVHPGLQDITAWVDFSRVAAGAEQAGLDVLGYTMQAHFLLGCGLAQVYEQAFAEAASETDQLRLAQGFKTLMMPGEMGERFKVIALGKGMGMPLSGFTMRDFRDRL